MNWFEFAAAVWPAVLLFAMCIVAALCVVLITLAALRLLWRGTKTLIACAVALAWAWSESGKPYPSLSDR